MHSSIRPVPFVSWELLVSRKDGGFFCLDAARPSRLKDDLLRILSYLVTILRNVCRANGESLQPGTRHAGR